ncbi:MAG: TIGR03790 family protein [Pirellulaceae bacterium]
MAELTPEQVVVVANRNSSESKKLAAYYLKMRGVPSENVMTLDVPATETIAREEFEKKVRPYVQLWLKQKDPSNKIRCFVTFWDVPLKIEAAESDTLSQELMEFLSQERKLRIDRLNAGLQRLATLAGGTEAAATIPDGEAIDQIQDAAMKAFEAPSKRIAAASGEEQASANEQLRDLLIAIAGLQSWQQSIRSQAKASSTANPQVIQQLAAMTGRLSGQQEGRMLIESLPLSLEREQQVLILAEQMLGLIGSVRWIDSEVEMLQRNETYSSFDSELGLAASSDYPLVRWQPNYLRANFDYSAMRSFRPSHMVSRIDGPSFDIARRLIDTAMEVEKTGLEGKVYLDSRGLAGTAGPPSIDANFDKSLVQAEQLLKTYTKMEVILDTRPELFKEGDCPNAALYCGWYSLAKYVDAFTWNPGAIGFHIASEEAKTLRDANSQVWCKRMLEDGVSATLGPVYEPYTQAFPAPDEFLLLLVSGRYSLAECYYRTVPHASWTLTLIGDPLYRPFAKNPQLNVDALPARYKLLVTGQL